MSCVNLKEMFLGALALLKSILCKYKSLFFKICTIGVFFAVSMVALIIILCTFFIPQIVFFVAGVLLFILIVILFLGAYKTLWALSFVIVLAISYIIYADDQRTYHSLSFNKEEWQGITPGPSLRGKGSNARCKMYGDLVKNYLKKGMTVVEVENLLGKSKHYYYCLHKQIKCANYDMGNCVINSLTIRPEDLQICFNKEQQVIKISKDSGIGEYCPYHEHASCWHEDVLCRCDKPNNNGPLHDCKINKW